MSMRQLAITCCVFSLCVAVEAGFVAHAQQTPASARVCACGAHPPGPPEDRVVTPYANEPIDLQPYSKFTEPYDLNYTHPNIYSGAARDVPTPADVNEVRIGFLGPIENHPQQVFGLRMLHGAQLAIEEANASGGYGGKPFRLVLHNDYDNWQANTVSGDTRPTDSAIWGSPSDEVVKMVYDDHDWAMFGSISSESTHIAMRVALRAEIPIINSASTDPTIPETYIPWFFEVLQDDRVQSFTLARHIFTELGLKRVAILRVNNRYGRFGVPHFRDASRRLGHPVVIEQKFMPGDTDFRRQLRAIQDSRTDAIVLWTDELPTAMILRQMRQMGMKQRVFGSHRTLGDTLLREAGAAAEGYQAVFPYDPTRNDPRWKAFQARYQARFGEPSEQFASLAYDAMNALLDAICEAGLNRARIHDALARMETYDGVTGPMVFDPNQKDVRPMYMGTVHDGKITYRLASMEKVEPPARSATQTQSTVQSEHELVSAQVPIEPYARVGEEPVTYMGPHSEVGSAIPEGPVRIVLFGPNAATIAASAQVQSALAEAEGGLGAGRRFQLLPIESAQSWGNASAQLVKDLSESHPLAIVALDRDAAHLSEQLALKMFVPVVALSSDKTLTSTNVPWIFRLSSQNTAADAIRLIEAGLSAGGRNPDQLRAILSSGKPIDGFAFATTGELLSK